jgi:prophage regulatory protein
MSIHKAMRLLRRPEVEQRTGLKRSAIYEGIAEGWFPPPVDIIPGGKAVGWLEHEIDDLIAKRIAARDSKAGA